MWNITVQKVIKDLDLFMTNEITMQRALDLMEASTNNVKEIVAINTLRESLAD